MTTIIEKFRAEIERLKGICTAQIKANPGQTFPFVMEMTGYDKLLSFLSDLEKSEKPTLQEQPVCEGLEEEFKKYWDEMPPETILDKEAFANTARHFAQWGAEHLKK